MRKQGCARFFCRLPGLLLLTVAFLLSIEPQTGADEYGNWQSFCLQKNDLCADSEYPLENGVYVGHDEPSVLFYSKTPGSGNSAIFNVVLPQDPRTLPKQNGRGGIFNFQLHDAFWFGMAMCDTQSAPEFIHTCTPDSDSNIFDNGDPHAPDYIGKHPGTALMELQFYPPGWVAWPLSTSCDGRHWCAAVTIDSLNQDLNKNINNNVSCQNSVGLEPVNFAFITTDGVADSPAGPFNPGHFTPNLSHELLMSPGDSLAIDMHDTPDGFQVVIYDLTLHKTGSMTASVNNGFAQVNFAPNASTCMSTPYGFHPMYATSGPHTRVVWTAHSYNVVFADEPGHFEYCDVVDGGGNCVKAGVGDPTLDRDDLECFNVSQSTRIRIAGCRGEDDDFDGVSYQLVWPGTLAHNDSAVHPRPIVFRSPLFQADGGALTNYSQVAFEANLPRIEAACDVTSGAGCTNPPPGAAFYPFFSTGVAQNLTCAWQMGGELIPGTTNTFGGNSTAEFGSLLPLDYPGTPTHFDNFRNILPNNPCTAPLVLLKLPGTTSNPIKFGTRKRGTATSKNLVILNSSDYPVMLRTLIGSKDYGTERDQCSGHTLAPGQNCSFAATFSPTVTGPDNGSIIVKSNANNVNPTINLIGAGL